MRGRLPSGRAVTVQVADGVVTGVDDGPDDADLPWLLPGLLDLQVNGYDGLDVNADPPQPAIVHDLTRALWRHGITGWCPTIITGGRADMLARVRAVAAAVAGDETTRHGVVGIHVEGPHLSPQDGARGVHEERHIRPPDIAELETWVEAAAGLLAIVTLSPEWDGAEDYVRACRARGVVAAIGHTAATPEQIRRCVDAGATLSTHLGNGAPATIPRHPNAIWAQLAADPMSASFIADGHHLPADALTAMIRAKTVPRSVLISDSTALAGRPPGRLRHPGRRTGHALPRRPPVPGRQSLPGRVGDHARRRGGPGGRPRPGLAGRRRTDGDGESGRRPRWAGPRPRPGGARCPRRPVHLRLVTGRSRAAGAGGRRGGSVRVAQA